MSYCINICDCWIRFEITVKKHIDSAIQLIHKLKEFIEQDGTISESYIFNGDPAVFINLKNFNKKLKGKYLKKSLVNKTNAENIEVYEKLIDFSSEHEITLANDSSFNVKFPLEKIHFAEKFIQIGKYKCEILNIQTISITIDTLNIDTFNFDNLSEVEIPSIIINFYYYSVSECRNLITEFILKCAKFNFEMKFNNIHIENAYKPGSVCESIKNAFYRTGSLLNNEINLNYKWRTNFYKLICCMVNRFKSCFENCLVNRFVIDQSMDDLLINPMVMMKIVSYLNKK